MQEVGFYNHDNRQKFNLVVHSQWFIIIDYKFDLHYITTKDLKGKTINYFPTAPSPVRPRVKTI